MNKAYAQLHAAVLLWGFTGILGKAISLSAPIIVWYRMLVATVILLIIISWRKEWQAIEKKDVKKMIGIGALFAAHWVAFYASIKLANASIALICLATASVFTTLLDSLLNKNKWNRLEVAIGGIAVIGVLAIYFLQPADRNAEQPMQNFNLGLVFGILASIISALFTVLNKPLATKYPARSLVFYEMLSGFVILSLIAPFYLLNQPNEVLLPQGWDYLWIFLLGYCCTVWAQSLAVAALRQLSPFTITLSVNLEPVYGIILAFVIFQENTQLGYGFYVGMTFIFFSLLLQTFLSIRKTQKARVIE